jgi:hypothetical protein
MSFLRGSIRARVSNAARQACCEAVHTPRSVRLLADSHFLRDRRLSGALAACTGPARTSPPRGHTKQSIGDCISPLCGTGPWFVQQRTDAGTRSEEAKDPGGSISARAANTRPGRWPEARLSNQRRITGVWRSGHALDSETSSKRRYCRFGFHSLRQPHFNASSLSEPRESKPRRTPQLPRKRRPRGCWAYIADEARCSLRPSESVPVREDLDAPLGIGATLANVRRTRMSRERRIRREELCRWLLGPPTRRYPWPASSRRSCQ